MLWIVFMKLRNYSYEGVSCNQLIIPVKSFWLESSFAIHLWQVIEYIELLTRQVSVVDRCPFEVPALERFVVVVRTLLSSERPLILLAVIHVTATILLAVTRAVLAAVARTGQREWILRQPEPCDIRWFCSVLLMGSINTGALSAAEVYQCRQQIENAALD